MLRDLSNNWTFVHIPCNAGTTVEYILNNTKDLTFDVPIPSTGIIHSGYQTNETDISKIEFACHQHMHAKYNDNSQLKLWTIIRNPYDREVTGWQFIKRHYYDKQIIPNQILDSFENYVQWKYIDLDQSLVHSRDAIIRKDDGDNYSYCYDDNQNDLIDHYIRFENLNEQWNDFAKDRNWPQNIFKIKLNSNNREHYSKYYTDRAREIVEPYCQNDCKTFGYQFETVD